MNTRIQKTGKLADTTIVTFLEKEIALGRKIVTLLNQEREAIVKMDVSALIIFSNTKNELFGFLEELDNNFRAVLEDLKNDRFENSAGPATFEELFQGEAKRQFQGMQRDWRSLREKIVTTNLVNHQFIQETLAFLGDSVALFAGQEPQTGGYGAVGKRKTIVNKPCVISREV